VETGDHLAMAVIHVVERSLAAAPAGEKDRRLALYALRTVVEDALRDFAPLWVFQDDRDNIVTVASSSGGPAWVEAIGVIESRASDSLAHALVIAHAAVPSAERSIPDAYEALSAEVANKSGHRTFVVVAQSYIDGHYGEPNLSLEEVAAAARISPGYLSRLLKHETGFSFVDYLTRVRINKAVQIMSDPAVKVYEVAEAVGYQSQHYFSRAFKRVFGRSPVEYRKGGEEG
jgi:two-component system response regulator YesN